MSSYYILKLYDTAVLDNILENTKQLNIKSTESLKKESLPLVF